MEKDYTEDTYEVLNGEPLEYKIKKAKAGIPNPHRIIF